QRGVVQVSTAELEQRLELQFRLHTAELGVGMIEQGEQIAEIFCQQSQFAVGQVVGGQLQQMPAGKGGIHRNLRKLVKRAAAQPRRAPFDERPRQHGDGLAAELAVVKKSGVVGPSPVRNDNIVPAEFD